MELRQLRYFIVLSEELHFNRAAKRLHLSQPPLTRQIRQLEEELGVALFYRTTRKVELTDAGHAFANEARQIVARVAHAAGLAAQANRGVVGQLVLGYTSSRTNLVAKAIKDFREHYPDVRISLRDMTGHNFQPIRDCRIDVGLVPLPIDKTGIIVETLLRERYLVAMAKDHRLSARRSISIRELAKEPHILFPRYSNPVAYDNVIGLCRTRDLSLNIVLEVENVHMRIELVREGLGICLVRTSTAEDLHAKDVVFRPLQNSPIMEVGIAYSPENRAHALPIFIDCMKHIFVKRIK